MGDAIIESIKEIPHGWALLGVCLAVVALQLRMIVRPRSSLGVSALAGAAILTVPVAAGLCLHSARAMMMRGFAEGDPSEKASAIGAGISGQINTIPFATTAVFVAVLLWLAGWKRAADARGRSAFPPFALVGLGLASIMIGIWQWSIQLIQGFARLAGLPPQAKPALLQRTLDFARAHLEMFARGSSWTIAGLGVIAIGLTVFDRPRADAEVTPGPPRRRGAAVPVVIVGALLASAALVAAARPMRAENELVWPAAASGDRILVVDPPTPDLEGPDPVDRAPVVQVFTDRIRLDGAPWALDELEGALVTLRNNFQLLNPSGTFNGAALIVADPRTPIAHLTAVLRAVHDADYANPVFAFTKPETLDRPAFGKLERVRATAARVALIDAYEAEAAGDDKADEPRTLVRLADFERYDALAGRLVALRRSGAPVVLTLGKIAR